MEKKMSYYSSNNLDLDNYWTNFGQISHKTSWALSQVAIWAQTTQAWAIFIMAQAGLSWDIIWLMRLETRPPLANPGWTYNSLMKWKTRHLTLLTLHVFSFAPAVVCAVATAVCCLQHPKTIWHHFLHQVLQIGQVLKHHWTKCHQFFHLLNYPQHHLFLLSLTLWMLLLLLLLLL